MRLPRRTLAAAAAALIALSAAGCSGQGGAAQTAQRGAPVARATASTTPAPTPRPVRSLAALGDSLTRGYDACSHYGDCPSASWVTGTNPTVRSIASRLTVAQDGMRPIVHNNARSGAEVEDLDRQVGLALRQRPDLVTVLIGANDACGPDVASMTTAADYAQAVDRGLHRLAGGLPEATILVASVPDLANLLPAAGGDETARFLWRSWGGCATALADPQSRTDAALARREAVRERIQDYNTALETTCATIERCVWDGGALQAYQPTIAQLSPLDYFHPSLAGLRELAAIEWRVLRRGG